MVKNDLLQRPSPINWRNQARSRWNAHAHWSTWARRYRSASPLIWVHAASVGEACAVEPIVRRVRAALDAQIIMTASSSSLVEWPDMFGTTEKHYLPLDVPTHVRSTFDALKPNTIILSRGDLWPGMLREAKKRQVPVIITGGLLGAHSRRMHPFLRPILQKALGDVAYVGAVDHGSAARWHQLGVPEDRIAVTGDPRHDFVLERPTNLILFHPLSERDPNTQPIVIAGSIEPADDAIVLASFQAVHNQHEDAILLFFPHDSTPSRLDGIRSIAKQHNLSVQRYVPSERPTGEVVMVDQPGLLADAYAIGTVGYVGGGFANAKQHSLIEPAVFGLPVAVGPKAATAREATSFCTRKAVSVLPSQKSSETLQNLWRSWIENPNTRAVLGLRARNLVRPGASSVTTKAILQTLPT